MCLASRLSTSFHTFCLVTSAVLVFAAWPEIRKSIKVMTFQEILDCFLSIHLELPSLVILILNRWTYSRLCDLPLSSFHRTHGALCSRHCLSDIYLSIVFCLLAEVQDVSRKMFLVSNQASQHNSFLDRFGVHGKKPWWWSSLRKRNMTKPVRNDHEILPFSFTNWLSRPSGSDESSPVW